MKERTLKLKWPFGRTLLLSVAILVGLVAAGELLLRWGPLQARLPYPSIGSSNLSLDVKLHLLNKMREREGAPECLFLGSSLVNAGIDPEAFTDAYRAATGKTIRCFNFGINAMTPYPAAKILTILVRRYRPKLVIWGVSSIDFNTRKKNRELQLGNNPWVRWQLGRGDFSGWLTDHSYLYRYYLRLRFWIDFPEIYRKQHLTEAKTTSLGYFKERSESLARQPVPLPWKKHFSAVMGDFKKDPRVSAVLKDAFRRNPGTKIVLAEMPLHREAQHALKGGKKTHDKIIRILEAFAARNQMAFIPFSMKQPFDDALWANYNHLNHAGALRFSRWLARRIGKAVQKGTIPDPLRRGKKP
jgi:hypothetical protein